MSKLTMSEMLKTLSSYQAQALDKGIDFSIDIYFNSQRIPCANVSTSFSVTGESTESHMLKITLSEDFTDIKNKKRLERINSFIQSISFYTE